MVHRYCLFWHLERTDTIFLQPFTGCWNWLSPGRKWLPWIYSKWHSWLPSKSFKWNVERTDTIFLQPFTGCWNWLSPGRRWLPWEYSKWHRTESCIPQMCRNHPSLQLVAQIKSELVASPLDFLVQAKNGSVNADLLLNDTAWLTVIAYNDTWNGRTPFFCSLLPAAEIC